MSFKKFLSIVAIGFLVSACSGGNQEEQNSAVSEAVAKDGAFVIIQESANKEYKIVEEYPSETTRIILRDVNGTEKILSQAEIDEMVKAEEKRIEEGSSELTNPTGEGLSLGETILASAAGAIIGSWIGSKLFGNDNYEQNRRASYSNPQAYERSINSFGSTQNRMNSNRNSMFSQTSTQTTKSTTQTSSKPTTSKKSSISLKKRK